MALRHFSSPQVARYEIDNSTTLQAAGTSVGATVVRAKKGRINMPILCQTDSDYITNFGYPTFTRGLHRSRTDK